MKRTCRHGHYTLLARARQERLNPRPLLVGQIRRVALGLLDLGHPATRRRGPHPKLETPPNLPLNEFSNGLQEFRLATHGPGADACNERSSGSRRLTAISRIGARRCPPAPAPATWCSSRACRPSILRPARSSSTPRSSARLS